MGWGGWSGLVGDDVQVVHDGVAAQVEQVLAGAPVAGTAALPAANLGQAVLDCDPLPQPGPALGGELAGAQLSQEVLVGVELHAAAPTAGGAPGPQRAGLADRSGELDLAAGDKRHPHMVGAGEQPLVEVEVERGLGEPGAVADRERLTEDGQLGAAVANQAAGSIRPVDGQLGQVNLLVGKVGGDLVGDAGLGDVGWSDPDRPDQAGVQVTGHVAL